MTTSPPPPAAGSLRHRSAQARWVLLATVLGSGIAFLDSTVVNVALPAIGEELDASLTGLQWTVNAYLVTLSALLLLGGSLGDRFGRRRVFVWGLGAFTVASLLCGIAPTLEMLIAARTLQGIGGALLVPGSLSIISATFHPDDRGRAIGVWSGFSGVASAIGPFVGGWFIDSVSWRLVFLINLPLAAIAIAVAVRFVPETRAGTATGSGGLDLRGAAAVTLGIGAISYAAIEHEGPLSVAAGLIGLAALVSFVAIERSSAHPMVPLGLFRIRQFSGANLTTFALYGGLGGAIFMVVLRLQVSVEYSALQAGAALVPFTVLMLLLSPGAGQVSRAIGPRLPMTVGPVVAGVGLWLLGDISAGDRYLTGVLPGVAVFGLGMAITVAPLTAAVLASVGDEHVGVASGVNNAVSRIAGLLVVAALPALSGISAGGSVGAGLDAGYTTALRICAALCLLGGLVAAATMSTAIPTRAMVHPSPDQACQDPAVATSVGEAGREPEPGPDHGPTT